MISVSNILYKIFWLKILIGAYFISGLSPSRNPETQFLDNRASLSGSSNSESAIALRVIYNGRVLNYKKQDIEIPKISFYGSG